MTCTFIVKINSLCYFLTFLKKLLYARGESHACKFLCQELFIFLRHLRFGNIHCY